MVFRDFCESGWGRAGAGWAGREGWAGRVGWAGQAGHVGGAGLRGRCTKERIFVHLLCPPGGGQTNEWMNEPPVLLQDPCARPLFSGRSTRARLMNKGTRCDGNRYSYRFDQWQGPMCKNQLVYPTPRDCSLGTPCSPTTGVSTASSPR